MKELQNEINNIRLVLQRLPLRINAPLEDDWRTISERLYPGRPVQNIIEMLEQQRTLPARLEQAEKEYAKWAIQLIKCTMSLPTPEKETEPLSEPVHQRISQPVSYPGPVPSSLPKPAYEPVFEVTDLTPAFFMTAAITAPLWAPVAAGTAWFWVPAGATVAVVFMLSSPKASAATSSGRHVLLTDNVYKLKNGKRTLIPITGEITLVHGSLKNNTFSGAKIYKDGIFQDESSGEIIVLMPDTNKITLTLFAPQSGTQRGGPIIIDMDTEEEIPSVPVKVEKN